MNIFRKKNLFESFVKIDLSYVFTINMYRIAENCMEKCLSVLLLYVPSQQLWSLRDGQFT